MTPTPSSRGARRPAHHLIHRPLAAAAAAATLAGCSPDNVVGPERARPAALTLATAGAGALASFGDTALVIPRVVDRVGRPVADAPLRWAVRTAGVVEQDAPGVFRAVGNGRVTVVAEVDPGRTGVRPAGYYAGPVADSVVLEVRQRPARLALVPADTLFTTLGATRQLRVQLADARGNVLRDAVAGLAWRSADTAVVTVDAAGVVRSHAEGAARITVEADGLLGAVGFAVRPRLPHTSCMRFVQRRQGRQACVTLAFTVRERGATR
jgi:hypothetical protein